MNDLQTKVMFIRRCRGLLTSVFWERSLGCLRSSSTRSLARCRVCRWHGTSCRCSWWPRSPFRQTSPSLPQAMNDALPPPLTKGKMRTSFSTELPHETGRLLRDSAACSGCAGKYSLCSASWRRTEYALPPTDTGSWWLNSALGDPTWCQRA